MCAFLCIPVCAAQTQGLLASCVILTFADWVNPSLTLNSMPVPLPFSLPAVPLIASLPGRLAEGATDDRVLTSGIDLFPTFCNVAGIPAPPDLCGVDLLKQHAGDEPPREALFAEAPFGGTMARDERYKLIAYRDDPLVQLFDLRDDPGETRNVADERPDVVARLASARSDFAARLKPVVPPPAKPAEDTGE